MRYNPSLQTVLAGAALTLPTSQVNSTGAIAASGTGGLKLEAGEYLVNFVSDIRATGSGNVGAAFALEGDKLAYTETLLSHTGNIEERIALNAILELSGSAVLTVINSSGDPNPHDNAVLTVVKLA